MFEVDLVNVCVDYKFCLRFTPLLQLKSTQQVSRKKG